MATPINPLPNLTQYNFEIGDVEEVVTKQNGVNAVLEQLGPQINATVASINEDVTNVNDAAANLNVTQIVHAPGSGLNNEAGAAYNRGVVGGSGALMALGYNGWGASTSDILQFTGDIDTLTTNGKFAVQQNTPKGATTLPAVIDVSVNSGGRLVQKWVDSPGVSGGLPIYSYIRRVETGGVWTEWFLEYNQGTIAGTVSYSGTNITGAIFETGENSFGRYIKYACGVMECFSPPLLISASATMGPNFYRSATASNENAAWTFPEAFSSTPIVTPGQFLSNPGWLTAIDANTADCRIIGMSNIVLSNITAYAKASGRWYE